MNPYLSEIRIFGFGVIPKGWAPCNGQILPINQNQALFSLLGVTYGGNGSTTFALPNLQGKVPMHIGNNFAQGSTAGSASVTLLQTEMPAHGHVPTASSNGRTAATPANTFWPSSSGFNMYAPTPNQPMSPQCLQNNGGDKPHDNMAPYLVVNYCIAIQGIFPSRS